ncbi:uncharacterized protein UDID_03426 [Ustilago sp. UG-2017a]|nr:uncharacterized protein UDID_03426 [Ustilago sp. UG-2017a]
MVNFIKLLGLWAILLFSMVSAKKLGNQQTLAWTAATDYLEEAHRILPSSFRTPKDIDIPEKDIKQAWEHAHSQVAGSLYTNKAKGPRRAIYALTKIPHLSELGQKWGLDSNPARNAYLLWQIKNNGEHKFLTAQTWPAGAIFPPGEKLQEVIERAAKL